MNRAKDVGKSKEIRLIRRPLLAKGIKAAGLDTLRFSTIIGHALSYQPSVTLFTTAPSPLETRYTTKKPKFFEPFSKVAKPRKAAPKPSKKTTKIDPEIYKKNDFYGCCLQYFPYENLELRAASVEIATSKPITKSPLETSPKEN